MTREVRVEARCTLVESGPRAVDSGTGDATMSRRKLRFYSVRCPEQLETRAMLAGNGFMPFTFGGHHFGDAPVQQAVTQFVSSAIAGQSAGHIQGGAHFGSHSASDETSFTATLTDSTGTATG